MTKALYRKYRSTKLAAIVGQDHIVQTLQNALKSNKINHAYLFTGPRGVGKTSIARILAHEINHFPYEIEDTYTDIIEIDAASHTGVDNIRNLIDNAPIAPTKGAYKIYIIDEVHMLSKSAFNALLKILEEPPAHVVFIMATTEIHKIPATILSRSQKFNFQPADPQIVAAHLQTIAAQENINITDPALELLARAGAGSFRDSISLLDQITTLKTDPAPITAAEIEQLLGLTDRELLSTLLENYENRDPAIFDTLKSALDTCPDPKILAEHLLAHIIENPTAARLALAEKLVAVLDSPSAKVKLMIALSSSLPVTASSSQTAVVRPQPQPPSIANTNTSTEQHKQWGQSPAKKNMS